MKYLFTWILCIIFIQCANAQQNFYVIFQSVNKAPFFIKYKAKVYSSSSSGFLILPKLNSGNQVVKVGLPKSEIPENTFLFDVANADANFLLQIENGAVVALKDANSSKLILSKNAEPEKAPIAVAEPAVSTPPIVVSTPQKVDEELKDTSLNNKPNTGAISDSNPIVEPINPTTSVPNDINTVTNKTLEPTVTSNSQPKIGVKKIIEKKQLGNGFVIYKYVVNYYNILDTITVEYPVTSEEANSLKEDKNVLTKKELETPDNNGDSKSSETTEPTSVLKNETPSIVEPATSNTMLNSNCTKIATNSEYISLRKKMAAYTEAVKLNEIALKSLKKKCYNTEQIKGLGGLYTTEIEKVNFYLIAYPFTLDSGNFKLLVNELKSEQAIALFREKVFK